MPTTFLRNPVTMSAPTSSQVSLHVTGTAEAATSSSGVKPAHTLSVEGTAGQETSGTGQTAGAGADIVITAGIGGAAPSGSTNGDGGTITINPGSPGIGAGTAAIHGDVLLATQGGNVGIGTASTDLQGGNRHARYLTLSGNGTLSNADGRLELVNPRNPLASGDTAGRITWLAPHNTGATSAAALGQITTQAAGSGGVNGFGGQVVIYTKPDNVAGVTPRVTIDPQGNVGIGTAAPGQKFVVSGGASEFNDAGVQVRIAHDTGGGYFGTVTNHAFRLLANNAIRMTMTASGNVGIGTDTPGQKLVVNGGAADFLDAGVHLRIAHDSGGGYMGTVSDSPFRLATNNATRLWVTAAGNVGIGIAAPSSALQVNGGVQVGAPTGGDMGAGSINVAGDVYKNGTPMLATLEKALATIEELNERIARLEAAINRSGKEQK